MNPIIISFISLLTVATPAKPATGHSVTVHTLAQQTDERAGRANSGSGTVIVYENAKDMHR
jgi:hypothetical protein